MYPAYRKRKVVYLYIVTNNPAIGIYTMSIKINCVTFPNNSPVNSVSIPDFIIPVNGYITKYISTWLCFNGEDFIDNEVVIRNFIKEDDIYTYTDGILTNAGKNKPYIFI